MDAHKNFAYSTVATAPSPAISGPTLTVATGDGSKFPTPPFNATVWPAGSQALSSNAEIVRVTAVSTDTLTITRTQESTSARTIVVGDQVQAGITAKTLTDVETSDNLREVYLRPSAAKIESIPRLQVGSGTLSINSGTLNLQGIALPAGLPVGSITFVSSGAATSPTHWWYGLYDSNCVQLALTADQLTAAFSSNTAKTLAVATTAAGSASSFTTTYEGLYYLGIMMAATTPCTLVSSASAFGVGQLVPVLQGRSDTGQTTPPAFPHTAVSSLSVGTQAYCYAYVS